MASAAQNLSEYESGIFSGTEDMHFGIVVAEWNASITNALQQGCYDTLIKEGVPASQIQILPVPGSFELVAGAQHLANNQAFDAIICIGCVIKGETKHDEYISNAVANGLMQLTLKYELPFVFGVLTPNSQQQAEDRAGGKYGNKGVEAATTALQMATTFNIPVS